MNFTIGETIRSLRSERAITQERLAEQLSVSAPAVSKWERGEAYPDITLIPRLAELSFINRCFYFIGKFEELSYK